MQTFFKHESIFFDIDIAIDRYKISNEYCLEISTIQPDTYNVSTFDTYIFSSEQERDEFENEILNKLKRIVTIDNELEDMLCQ